MDNYEKHEVMLVFRHRGRDIQLRASAAGWAALYLRNTRSTIDTAPASMITASAPCSKGRSRSNSILRDWIKGQIMAIETGILYSNTCSCRSC